MISSRLARTAVAIVPWLLLALGLLRFFATVLVVRSPHGLVFGNDFVDLGVYRMGGSLVLHGSGLYGPTYSAELLNGTRVEGLPFTYPVFAAVMMIPLSVVPFTVAAAAMTLLSLACIGVVAWLLADRLPMVASNGVWPWSRRTSAIGLFGLILAMEPATSTLEMGQVNLILMAAVLVDVLVSYRGRGLLTGLATGIKLTPAVFVLAMAVTRRWREALFAAVTFAVTVAIGFALQPSQALQYWRDFASPTASHDDQNPMNQSLYADVVRLLGPDRAGRWPLLVSLAVIVVSLVICRALWRYEPISATLTVAFGGLLASPISWNTHWVWIGPAVAVLAALAVRARGRSMRGIAALTAAVSLGAFAVHLLGPTKLLVKSDLFGGSSREWVLANVHVATGLVMVATFAVVAWRAHDLWPTTALGTAEPAADADRPAPVDGARP